MAKIIWTDDAVSDLKEIIQFISFEFERQAARVGDKLIKRVDVLSEFVRIGRVVPEFERENLRELIEQPYRIIYELKSEEELWIIRIHHSARLLKSILT